MKLYKFKISGKTSVFKRSDQNGSNTYSYTLLTQQSLKGILGAIIGLKGYDNSGLSPLIMDQSLEFNEVFKNLKISIVPVFNEDNFMYYYNTRTNATGLANKKDAREGVSLLLREQWIVNVEYMVYLDVSLIEETYREKLEHNLKNEEAEFIPYLGRREHFAKVYGFELVDGIKEEGKAFVCISTLPRADMNGVEQISKDSDDIIAFSEISPSGITPDFYHTFKEFVYTNQKVELNKTDIEGQYYKVNEGTLCLY